MEVTTVDESLVRKFPTREAWLEGRRTLGIGSSDAAAILGVSRFQSPLSLYYDKIGEGRVARPELEEFREWGQILEEPIGHRYAAKTNRFIGRPPAHSFFVSAQYPFAIASLDFIVCGVRENGLRPPVTYETLPPVGALEVKNASVYVAKEWGEENNNEPPLQYQIQLQHQLMVTGLAWGSIAALVGGSHFIWADRARDEQLINIIAEKEAEFWQRVIDRRPPEADGAEATREILRQIYPKDTGESIALDAEAIEWHEALVAAKGQKKVAEFDIDTYSNKLRQAIGDATVATLPNGVVYTHKWQDRAAYSVEAGGSRILRASAAKKGR